ncbi:MAG: glycosyltransferase, partial [Phycisphaerae bacterium]
LVYPPPTKWHGIPGTATLAVKRQARRISRAIEAFGTTGLVLRTAGLLALELLKYSTTRKGGGLPTLVLFANSFLAPDRRSQRLNRELARLCNHPSVLLVGNHRQVSTQSMIDYGVLPAKAVAYDWPGARHPRDYPVKTLDPARPVVILYAATMIESKGIGDLIAAVGILVQRGLDVRLSAFGTGPDESVMRALAERVAPGRVSFPGRVDNDVLFKALRECTLVCVPSRPEWQEGGSLILTEALASRTPVVLSDQPMFARTFHDGEGVRFFKAADPASLAAAIDNVLAPANGCLTYQKLSETAVEAFGRAECTTTMGEVLMRWRAALS